MTTPFFDYDESYNIRARALGGRPGETTTYRTRAVLKGLPAGVSCAVYVEEVEYLDDREDAPEDATVTKLRIVRKTCRGNAGSTRYKYFGTDEIGGAPVNYERALADGIRWARRQK